MHPSASNPQKRTQTPDPDTPQKRIKLVLPSVGPVTGPVIAPAAPATPAAPSTSAAPLTPAAPSTPLTPAAPSTPSTPTAPSTPVPPSSPLNLQDVNVFQGTLPAPWGHTIYVLIPTSPIDPSTPATARYAYALARSNGMLSE
ncbi:hypothetical protein BJY52DRAFT_1197490 [Lactarius psammicola]|nr:hypothetical protein BJY52DRAFT_1197490 [Lactarius psammicola]